MNNKCKNIYKLCRVSSGMTQESASEKLDIVPRTLSNYENDGNVPDHIVDMMAEIYNMPELVYWHLKKYTPYGRWLPEILETENIHQMGIYTILAKDETLKAEMIIRKILTEKYEDADIIEFEIYISSALCKLLSLELYLKKVGCMKQTTEKSPKFSGLRA